MPAMRLATPLSLSVLLATCASSAWAAAPLPGPKPLLRCPADMQLVQGTHYEHLQRMCSDYRGSHCFSFLPGLVLKEPRATPIATCIDRYEWPNQAGTKPAVMMRFSQAAEQCQAVGKRLCTEFEWELACEGPRYHPFSYGFAKQPQTCNVDRPYRPYHGDKLNSSNEQVRDRETVRLYQGVASGSLARCRSPFGAFDMVGNVEEWVTTSRPEWPYRSSLKGGYWSKPWAGCRGTNERHGPGFRFYQIGFRCCRSASPSSARPTAAPARRSALGLAAFLSPPGPTVQSVGYTSLPSSASSPSTPLAYLGRSGSSPGS